MELQSQIPFLEAEVLVVPQSQNLFFQEVYSQSRHYPGLITFWHARLHADAGSLLCLKPRWSRSKFPLYHCLDPDSPQSCMLVYFYSRSDSDLQILGRVHLSKLPREVCFGRPGRGGLQMYGLLRYERRVHVVGEAFDCDDCARSSSGHWDRKGEHS